MRSWLYGALFSLGSIALTPAWSAGHSVGVLEFGGRDVVLSAGERQQLVEAVRDVARRSLPRGEGWTVLTQDKLQARIASAASSETNPSDCDDEKCVVSIGRGLNLDYVVSENIGRMGSHLQVYLSFYEMAGGRLLGSEWFRGKTTDDIVDALETSPDKLFAGSGESRAAKSAEPAAVNPPATGIQSEPPETQVIMDDQTYYDGAVIVDPWIGYPYYYCCDGGGWGRFHGGYRGGYGGHGGHGRR